jgi:hypothetical protein
MQAVQKAMKPHWKNSPTASGRSRKQSQRLRPVTRAK